jgi:ketosteroid isomerase-like protein
MNHRINYLNPESFLHAPHPSKYPQGSCTVKHRIWRFSNVSPGDISRCSLHAIDHKETVADVELRKVVLHLRDRASTAEGDFDNEYIFTLFITEDGRLLDEIVECIDSADR